MEFDAQLMRMLNELLAHVNVYAQSYEMMSEVERAELALAELENRQPLSIRMIFDAPTGRGLSRRPYDLPIVNEVAVIYVGEEGDVPVIKSLAVHLRHQPGHVLNIRDTDKICDPLSYPLLFPTGEAGWDTNMRNTNGLRTSKKSIIPTCSLYAIRSTPSYTAASFASRLP